MDCDIIRDLLPLYIDGVCSEASRSEVEAHLQNCPDCCLPAQVPPAPPADISSAPVNAMQAAKHALLRTATLRALGWMLALLLAVTAGGIASLGALEKERPVTDTANLITAAERTETGIRIQLSLPRFTAVQVIYRRIPTGDGNRDVAILRVLNSPMRRLFDRHAEGDAWNQVGAGTNLYVSGGGLRYLSIYGAEYGPESWNPNWRYPGNVSEVYLWTGDDRFDALHRLDPEEIPRFLEADAVRLDLSVIDSLNQ